MYRNTHAGRLAVVLVLAVAGCSTTPAPGPATSSNSGASSSPATSQPTPTPSTATAQPYPTDVPAEARVNSPEGALAFARHFFTVVNTVYIAPISGAVAALSTANCKSCEGMEQEISWFVAAGRRYDRPAVDVREVSLNPGTPTAGGAVLVDIVVHQRPAKIIDAQGAMIDTVKESTGVIVMTTVFRDGGFRADSIQVAR